MNFSDHPEQLDPLHLPLRLYNQIAFLEYCWMLDAGPDLDADALPATKLTGAIVLDETGSRRTARCLALWVPLLYAYL